jgi:hypothetical protein
MRSIPLALTLDTLRRGRWTLPSLALAVNAMPLLLLTALRASGAIHPEDPSHIVMHIVLTQVNMWVFGVVVISAQGPISKLFSLPLTSATIVLWRMLLLVVLAALQSVLSTLLINALFDVNWPLWGPALLLAVSMAGAQAIVWYADKSAWSVPMLAGLAMVYGLWMKSRYGAVFSHPDHYWREVTLADAAFMLAMVVAAYLLGVVGVARSRRGEPPLSLGIVDALQRMLQVDVGPVKPFRSPLDAQFWFEWRKNGWVMPAGAAFGLLLALLIWTAFNRNLSDLWEGMFALGACLTILGFVGGLIAGHSGRSDTDYDMGSFLATRPVTTTSLAHTLLKTCALSALLAWLIWAVAYAGVYLVLRVVQSNPIMLLPGELSWWYYPLTLLGPWVAITLVASCGLSGRMLPFIVVSLILFVGWVVLALLGKFALSQQQQQFAQGAFLIAVATACITGTFAAFIAAWQRGLIGWPVIYVGGSLWLVLTAASILTLTNRALPLQSLLAATVASAIFALTVAPLATAPLALAWNRTR